MSNNPYRQVKHDGFTFYVPDSLAYRLCLSIEQHMGERALVQWHLIPESERHQLAVDVIFGNIDTRAVRREVARVVRLDERDVFFKRKGGSGK